MYKNKLGQRLYTSIVEISMHDTVMDYVVHFCCDLFSLCLWVNCFKQRIDRNLFNVCFVSVEYSVLISLKTMCISGTETILALRVSSVCAF